MSAAARRFQKEGVHFGVQRKGRALIADEMGLVSFSKERIFFDETNRCLLVLFWLLELCAEHDLLVHAGQDRAGEC